MKRHNRYSNEKVDQACRVFSLVIYFIYSSLKKLSPFDKLKKEEQESTADIAIKLRELASLRDDGIITDQEIKKMKEGILFKK